MARPALSDLSLIVHNVSIDIAAVVYYRISDPEKIGNRDRECLQCDQPDRPAPYATSSAGSVSISFSLIPRAINEQIKGVIDKHTEPWGTQVAAVEIKDITLPENMQRAMAKEAEAERERRAKIVAAEGEFQAAVKLGPSR
jgi:regulator of protease activity HflC (stomatin/prohibitin superfamily)